MITATQVESQEREYADLTAEIGRLGAALTKYGAHLPNCTINDEARMWCDCGWLGVLDGLAPRIPSPPAANDLMHVSYEKIGRCLWHLECDKTTHGSGIMREVMREETRSLLECLHCGRRCYIPVGGIDWYVSAEASPTVNVTP